MQTESTPAATPPLPPEPPAAASRRALTAAILGILSITCTGFLTGIPAIILGQMELSAIKNGSAPKAGQGQAKMGLVLGIVGTVITFLAILALAALVALGISLGTSMQIRQLLNLSI